MNPFPYTAPVVDTRYRSPADETVGDRGRTFKPTARTEGGDGRPRAIRARPAAHTLDVLAQSSQRLVERNRATPVEHLARKLLGARTRAFERHQQAGFHLRLCACDRLIDGLGAPLISPPTRINSATSLSVPA